MWYANWWVAASQVAELISFRVAGRGSIYFLRHGESQGNVARVAQGRADFPLSDRGREQAALAGNWFQDKGIDLVLSSPLLRASQTAEIVARTLTLPEVLICEELNEVDIGPFSGLTWSEASARHPKAYRRFQRYSWDGVWGAEGSDVLYRRAEAAWALLLDHFQQGRRRLLAVTHSGTLQWIIKSSLGHQHWLPLFPMHNCSIFQFSLNNRILPPDASVGVETPAYYCAWELMGLQID